jgi:predicted metalloprotease with PDZ domain
MKLQILLCCALILCPPTLRADKMRPSAEEIQTCVTRLGAETFKDREAAQKKLKSWGDTFPRHMIATLSEHFKTASDLEVKLRLEELLRPLAMEYIFDIPPGFLGVNLGSTTLENGEEVIAIQSVQPGHAAAAAGLLPEDMIVSVDGRSIQELGGQQGFIEQIASLAPGIRTELLIQRAGKRFLQVVEIGPRPADNSRAERHQAAQRAVNAWMNQLAGINDQDPDFPIGHFPLD